MDAQSWALIINGIGVFGGFVIFAIRQYYDSMDKKKRMLFDSVKEIIKYNTEQVILNNKDTHKLFHEADTEEKQAEAIQFYLQGIEDIYIATLDNLVIYLPRKYKHEIDTRRIQIMEISQKYTTQSNTVRTKKNINWPIEHYSISSKIREELSMAFNYEKLLEILRDELNFDNF